MLKWQSILSRIFITIIFRLQWQKRRNLTWFYPQREKYLTIKKLWPLYLQSCRKKRFLQYRRDKNDKKKVFFPLSQNSKKERMKKKFERVLRNSVWKTTFKENIFFPIEEGFFFYLFSNFNFYPNTFQNGKNERLIVKAGNTNWGGRHSTIDLLIKVACFAKRVKNIFKVKRSWSKLVVTRRSTVLIPPLY